MYLIVMNQGKSRDKLRDDLYKKKLIYFNSVTWNVKESTETSWFHPSKDHSNTSFAVICESHVWHLKKKEINCFYIRFWNFSLILTVSLKWILNKMLPSYAVRAVCPHPSVKSWLNSFMVYIHYHHTATENIETYYW